MNERNYCNECYVAGEKEVSELESELEKYKNALELACKYIDHVTGCSSCDFTAICNSIDKCQNVHYDHFLNEVAE